MKQSGLRFLTIHTQRYDLCFQWQGHHNYEIGSPGVVNVNDNANSVISWASAFQGELITVSHLKDISYIGKFDVVLFVGQDYFHTALPLIPEIRRRFPHIIILGLSEAPLRMHKAYCRVSWEYQRVFYEFSNLVDMMLTWHSDSVEYYGLFNSDPSHVIYFPHPYPFEYVSTFGAPLAAGERKRVLYKAGSMHGRPGTDGYADIVPVIRAWRNHPEFKIQLYAHAGSFRELMDMAERRPHDFRLERYYRGLERKMQGGGKSPLHQKVIHWLQRVLYERPTFPDPVAPLTLRGVPREAIQAHGRKPWRQMLPLWRETFLALDLDSTFTQGRNVKDAAAFGTPVIGVNSDFQRQLYPALQVEELDYSGAEALVERLIADPDFYVEVSAHAYGQIQRFGYEISRRRFAQFVEEYRAGRRAWTAADMIALPESAVT